LRHNRWPEPHGFIVKVSFSNLSSPEVVAHVAVGLPSESGTFVQGLPNGQVDGTTWTFKASGAYTAADLVTALKNGSIYVSIDTANFPGGELRGQFIRNTGSSEFTPPSAPPALPTTPLTAQDASRFLTQATFGYTRSEVNNVMASGVPAWISTQMAKPISSHRAGTMADYVAFPPSATATVPTGANRQSAWWKIAVTSDDQLRQRVASASCLQKLVQTGGSCSAVTMQRRLSRLYQSWKELRNAGLSKQTIAPSIVPEPGSLLGFGAVLLVLGRRFFGRKA